MTCKERILSNDYVDVLFDFVFPKEYNIESQADYCYHSLNGNLGIFFIERSAVVGESNAIRSYYSFLPKCYGLMELGTENKLKAAQDDNLNTLALTESGILSVQRGPLNLTGKNVTIGFIDTGVRYQDPVFLDIGEKAVLSVFGIRQSRQVRRRKGLNMGQNIPMKCSMRRWQTIIRFRLYQARMQMDMVV